MCQELCLALINDDKYNTKGYALRVQKHMALEHGIKVKSPAPERRDEEK
jgi:hypothetical protein